MERDVVDEKLDIWARELPALDLPTEALVERIQKLARYLNRSLDETASQYGLTLTDWRVLGSLRGAGPTYRLPAGAIAEQLSLSPGAITQRLDGLERAGFLRRIPDATDRRVLQIELTPEGRQRWDEAVGVQAAKEQLVAAALGEDEKQALNALLRKLMLSFAASAGAKAAVRQTQRGGQREQVR
jgi:DNA-binding MarR family transcriptional regulator